MGTSPVFLTDLTFRVATGTGLGLIFFVSWLGYGYLLERLLGYDGSLPWGLRACLGMSVLICLGGLQAFFGIVSLTSNLLVVTAGCLLFLLGLKGRRKHMMAIVTEFPKGKKYERFFFFFLRIASLAILTVYILGSLVPFWLDECDDWLAYFLFPKLMLQTGTFIEPFNLRRIASLGGLSFLQTFLYPVFGTSAVPFTDIGLGKILIWAVMLGFSPGSDPTARLRREALAFVGLILSSAMLIVNHSPAYIPIALFICLLTLCLRFGEERSLSSAHVVILGFLSASIITIKNSFAVFVFIFLLLHWALTCRFSKKIGEDLGRLSAVFLVSALCLASWMMLSFKSSGTVFYPLFKGNFTYPYGLSEPMDVAEKVRFILDKLWSSKSVVFVALAVIAALSRRCPKFALAVAATAVISLIAVSLSLTAADSFNIYRYCQPFSLAGICVLVGILFTDGAVHAEHATGPLRWKLGIITILVLFWWVAWPSTLAFNEKKIRMSHGAVVLSYTKDFYSGAERALRGNLDFMNPDNSASYRQVQEFLPRDAKVLSATAQPFLWDFSMQQIHTLDCIGQVSPPPGMPFFKGPEKLADYFKGLGYRYIVYTPYDQPNCLYYFQKWQAELIVQRRFIWTQWAPYFIDFFSDLVKMEMRGALVFQNADLRVIDLQRI